MREKTSSRWTAAYRCIECKHTLNHHEYKHSNGVCPYCGAVGDGSFVRAEKGRKRAITNKRFWILNKVVRYEYYWGKVNEETALD